MGEQADDACPHKPSVCRGGGCYHCPAQALTSAEGPVALKGSKSLCLPRHAKSPQHHLHERYQVLRAFLAGREAPGKLSEAVEPRPQPATP